MLFLETFSKIVIKNQFLLAILKMVHLNYFQEQNFIFKLKYERKLLFRTFKENEYT